MSKPTCAVDECPKESYLRGWCNAHYLRNQRTGSPTGSQRKTAEERFWEKVQKTDTCWNWMAYTMPTGYGQFGISVGKLILAHRFAYEAVNGSIPQDKELDHTCFNRSCVNPSHLRLASRKQNSEHRRGALANNKSSGVRGVYPVGNRWMARVGHNGKTHYLGLFATIAEAEAVAIATRIELFTHNDVDRMVA
jgi:hypothetical protein